MTAELAQQVRLGGGQVPVTGEVATALQVLDLGQPGPGAIRHGQRDRAVERDHGRGPDLDEPVVELEDLRPVSVAVARCFSVQGGDRGLQREPARPPAPQRAGDQRGPLADRATIPL